MALVNPLTPFVLARTIFFQIGIIGTGTFLLSFYGVNALGSLEAYALKASTKAKRIILLMVPYTGRGVGFIFLVGTLGVLLTDIGWPPAFQQYGLMALIFARASDAPNGAHLLSYIPLPLVGLYVAWKFRKDYLLDCFQGIVFVGFGVAFHELPWLLFYLLRYYVELGLFVGSNFLEDLGFGFMCVLLIIAWWKYPNRAISLKALRIPFLAYLSYLGVWFAFGLPVTTINNFMLGKGPFEITQWWADPWVNGVEVASWLMVAGMLALVVRQSKEMKS